ncbi:hypothetical protein KJ627_03835 [Patescibacteria group bacterium]|nr:hypothetical protein [Patescibacteria group bacterium]
MKKTRIKAFSKIMAFVMIFTMTMAMGPGMAIAASRLTSAKDTLSTTKASGTGSAITGYTQSTQSVTDDFIVVNTENDIICIDTAGGTASSTCDGANDVKVDLITNGGAVTGSHYTGDELAAIIATGLAAVDGDADDAYTVTYAESSDLFSIRADGGNTLNPSIAWLTYTGTDDADATLGYTADDSAIRDTTATSDTAVAFNVRTSDNDAFTISVNSEAAVSVTITQGVYTAATLVAEMNTQIDAASTDDATVSYSSDKFKITSDLTGANSSIVVTEGANDFLRSVRMNGDVPVDGAESAGIVSSDHTITFTTAVTTADDKIVITFPSNFDLTGINFEDVDMAGGTSGEITLAATAAADVWGAAVSGQVLTLTGATSGATTTLAAETITIQIGRNATAGVAGTEQIANPTTAGLYEITIEQKDSSDVIEQDANIAVYIVSDDSVVVKATVDPLLSFAIQGGNVLDFGTLEPNAYHKLGGARSAYGYIELTGVTVAAGIDTQTVTVHSKVYELSDDGVASSTDRAIVMIVDNENNYLTSAQVANNLYRAINNNDGDLVRANIDNAITDQVDVMAIGSGETGNAYTLATTVTNGGVSGADFTDGVLGYNKKATEVAYAGGTDVGNSQIGNNLVISTNSAGGYAITVENTDNGTEASGLTNGTTNIDSWTTGTYGYGILASAQSARYGDGTSGIIASAFRGDGTGDLPEAMNTTATTLASYAGTTANDNIGIEYNVRIDANQPAGAYSDTITYIATATY